MDLIQYINQKEKEMNIEQFIENRKKIAGKEKAMDELKVALEKFSEDEKAFLTPVGTEIHSAPSVISTKVRPVTLRDKLKELEELSQRVMDQKILQQTLDDMQGDDDPEFTDEDDVDIEEDLSFGSKEHVVVDENGDKSIEIAEDDGEESPAPTAKGDEQPKSEVVEDGGAE